MSDDPTTSAELLFRTKHRDKWAAFLSSEAGACLISSLYGRKPSAIPSQLPHQDSHRLGQIMNFDLTMKFIAVDLLQPIKNTEEVPQDYPDDETNPPPITQEPKP